MGEVRGERKFVFPNLFRKANLPSWEFHRRKHAEAKLAGPKEVNSENRSCWIELRLCYSSLRLALPLLSVIRLHRIESQLNLRIQKQFIVSALTEARRGLYPSLAEDLQNVFLILTSV